MLKFPGYSNMQSMLKPPLYRLWFCFYNYPVLRTMKGHIISFNDWYQSCTLWCVKQFYIIYMIFARNSFYTVGKNSNGKWLVSDYIAIEEPRLDSKTSSLKSVFITTPQCLDLSQLKWWILNYNYRPLHRSFDYWRTSTW